MIMMMTVNDRPGRHRKSAPNCFYQLPTVIIVYRSSFLLG